jgi:hypothetical protein
VSRGSLSLSTAVISSDANRQNQQAQNQKVFFLQKASQESADKKIREGCWTEEGGDEICGI